MRTGSHGSIRTGLKLVALAAPGAYTSVRLSPDDSTLLFTRTRPELGTRDIWSTNLSRPSETRVTSSPGHGDWRSLAAGRPGDRVRRGAGRTAESVSQGPDDRRGATAADRFAISLSERCLRRRNAGDLAAANQARELGPATGLDCRSQPGLAALRIGFLGVGRASRARRQTALIHVGRVEPAAGLRLVISGQRRKDGRVDGRRRAGALGARRAGALLHRKRSETHGCLDRRRRRARHTSPPLRRDELVGLRRGTGRAVSSPLCLRSSAPNSRSRSSSTGPDRVRVSGFGGLKPADYTSRAVNES